MNIFGAVICEEKEVKKVVPRTMKRLPPIVLIKEDVLNDDIG